MATVGSEKVLEFLKKNYGQEFAKQEIASAVGVSISTVSGSVKGLKDKGHVTERIEEIAIEGSKKPKQIRYVQLTESGLSYDPVAEAEAKAAAIAASRAARAAAKAAKQNAEQE